jgi:hypothetical protein
VSIAIDSAGTPYLTYYDQDTNDLILAIRDGSDWTLETVDAEGDAGQFAELVTMESDADDVAHIATFEVTDAGPLKGNILYFRGAAK